LTKLNLEPHSF